MKRKVVITGMGVITPLGNTVAEFWAAILAGKSGVGPLERFDASEYPARIAGEIRDFDGSLYSERKQLRRMDISAQYAMGASAQAVKDSGLDLDNIDLDRCGVVIGSGIGGINTFEKQHSVLEASGPGRVSPFFIPMMIIDMCAGLVSIQYGFRGPNYATVSACASSSHAILDSMRIIQRGDADVMIAGGTEATITPTSVAGFCQAKALSTRNDEPERASRPFDVGRDGFVMGEGAAMLILESEEHAKARGAKMHAEIVGAGMTGDAHHMTAPHPEGYGARRAMQLALEDSGLEPEKISHINAHGTSTTLGDIVETSAIKHVLGEHAYKIPINSTKSMIGHLLGAAGAVELVTCVMSIKDGVVHPTINLDDPDPECDLDYVPHKKKVWKTEYAVSNSFGFGGHNVSLIVGHLNGQ